MAFVQTQVVGYLGFSLLFTLFLFARLGKMWHIILGFGLIIAPYILGMNVFLAIIFNLFTFGVMFNYVKKKN